MAWSGGSFTRTNGVNTGSTLWADDRDAGTKIRADRHDTHDQDMADGINATLKKDGGNTPTADLPMNGQKHTGVGNAAARDQYAAVGQVQDSAFNFISAANVAGTADAITLTPSPAITAYAAGQHFAFIAEGDNTGATTVNVSGLGAKAVQLHGSALVADDIKTGDMIEVRYDGTQFQMVSPERVVIPPSVSSGTNQATTSGSSKDFTIPAGTKWVLVSLDEVSTDGTTNLGVQLGDSGGIETTGYTGRIVSADGASFENYSTHFTLNDNHAATDEFSGHVELSLVDSTNNVWIATVRTFEDSAANEIWFGVGRKALSGEATTVRLECGSDAFDNGSVNVLYM